MKLKTIHFRKSRLMGTCTSNLARTRVEYNYNGCRTHFGVIKSRLSSSVSIREVSHGLFTGDVFVSIGRARGGDFPLNDLQHDVLIAPLRLVELDWESPSTSRQVVELATRDRAFVRVAYVSSAFITVNCSSP